MRRHFLSPLCLLPLLLLSAATAARAQANYLRNADAAEGAAHWRAYGDAKVEETPDGPAFVLRAGGYFIQHARVPDEAAGQYALLVAEAKCVGCPAGAARGGPSLYGDMMDPGTTHEGGRVYAYLQSQTMRYPPLAEGWHKLWGVFKIPKGTGTVSFFLKQNPSLGEARAVEAAHFRAPGLHIFPTREAALAFLGLQAGTVAAGAPETPAESGPRPAPCEGASLKTLSLGGVRLGMSVEEVLKSMPGSASDATVRHMLERSRSAPNAQGHSHAFVDVSYARDPNLSGVEKYWVKFLDGRLYAVQVIYRGASWGGAEAFVTGMSGALALPPAEAWESMAGSAARYIICDDVELRFYAAPAGTLNTDYILLADRKAERTLAERKTKSKEAANR